MKQFSRIHHEAESRRKCADREDAERKRNRAHRKIKAMERLSVAEDHCREIIGLELPSTWSRRDQAALAFVVGLLGFSLQIYFSGDWLQALLAALLGISVALLVCIIIRSALCVYRADLDRKRHRAERSVQDASRQLDRLNQCLPEIQRLDDEFISALYPGPRDITPRLVDMDERSAEDEEMAAE